MGKDNGSIPFAALNPELFSVSMLYVLAVSVFITLVNLYMYMVIVPHSMAAMKSYFITRQFHS
jgi:hypothetical protein